MDLDLPPERRSLRARLAAHASWDGIACAASVSKAACDRFDRQVDPDGVLPPQERAKRAANARAAHYARMALRSSRVRAAPGACARGRDQSSR